MISIRTFLHQLMYYIPAQIFPAVINLLTVMILARALTVGEYGDYSLFIMIASFSVTILTQWFIQALFFYSPKYIENGQIEEFNFHYRKGLFFLTTIMGTIILSMLVIHQFFFNLSIVYILSLLVLVQAIFTLEQATLQSGMKFKMYTYRVFISTLIRFIMVVLLSFNEKLGVTNILIILLISYSVFVLPKIKSYLIIEKINTKLSTIQFYEKMFVYGLPMLGWFLCTSFMHLSDRLIIKGMHGSEEMGIYSGNYSIISAALGLIFVPLNTVIHPILLKETAKEGYDLSRVEGLIKKFTTIYFVVGLPVLILVYLFRKEVVILLLSEKYVVGSDIIPILMVGMFLWSISMVGHKGMEIQKDTKLMFVFILYACIANIIVNVVLINKFSYVGASIGNMLAFSLYCILVYINSKNNIRWKIDFKVIGLLIVLVVIIAVNSTLIYKYFMGKFDFNNYLGIIIFVIIFIVQYVLTILVLIRRKLISISF